MRRRQATEPLIASACDHSSGWIAIGRLLAGERRYENIGTFASFAQTLERETDMLLA
jgi:hypothetical protein